ncbi:MAG: hypothetical protein FWC00_02190 [Firmicutes bacterium]|nr:hypothetical protein [Bacillota bacterium]
MLDTGELLQDAELIQKGVSGAECYTGLLGGQKVFLKFFEDGTDIRAIEKIYLEYTDSDIRTPKVLKTGVFNNKNYIITEFIPGGTLKENLGNIKTDDIYKIGCDIGKSVKKVPDDKLFFQKFKESKLELVRRLREIKHLDQIKVSEIINYVEGTIGSFQDESLCYGHGDIKPANFMYNNGDILAIDIDGTSFGYFSWKVRGNVALDVISEKSDKTKMLYLGFVHGFYDGKIPTSYQDQFLCTRVIERMWNIVRDFDKGNVEKVNERWARFTDMYMPLDTLKTRYEFEKWLFA